MRRPCSPLLAILILAISATTVSAAAPHIMLFQGELLDRPIAMSDWQENHIVMGSLSEEGAAKDEVLTDRQYIDVALFWGPKWFEYKTSGGSVNALTHAQANQKARLYLARGDSAPVLVFEGKAPRYVGPEGVRVLTQHGVPLKPETRLITKVNSQNSMWLTFIGVPSLVLFLIVLLNKVRMHTLGRKEHHHAVR
jgi:hypothetical protein